MDSDRNDEGSYHINIEGKEYPWDRETVSREELVILGGWDAAQGVLEIDADNNERTLQAGEVVHLKPGHGFAKKVKFRRGGR
jgi:hypothetical protein